VSKQSPKHKVFEQLAKIGGALSSAVRLELLELLAQGERSVEALSSMTGVSVANTSQHLQKLRQAGLVVVRKKGLFVFYRVAGEEAVRLLRALANAGQAYSAEIERIVRLYFLSKDDFEPVPADELLKRARAGLVTVLDVRPPEEFAAGHIPGAVNIPLGALEKRLREIPKRKEVIAYCRGPFCLLAFEAVHLLRKKGIKARRLADGMPEWRTSGLRVEVRYSG
jgi:rhodanese-related sulfurtransferase/biotin operon repressor